MADDMIMSGGHIFALQEVNVPQAMEDLCIKLRHLSHHEESWCCWVSPNLDPASRHESAAFVWKESESCCPWDLAKDAVSSLRVNASLTVSCVCNCVV